MRRSWISLSLGLMLANVGASHALSMAPTTILIPGDQGSIDFLFAVQGLPAGGSITDGAITPTDWTFVFRAVDTGTHGFLAPPPMGRTFSAAGVIPGPESDTEPNLDAGFWNVGPLAFGTTDPFFFSIPHIAIGDEIQVISPAFAGSFTVVPEPSHRMLLLLGFCLALVYLRRAPA